MITKGCQVKKRKADENGVFEQGSVAAIDVPSQALQLDAWLDAGRRTRWEPLEWFDEVPVKTETLPIIPVPVTAKESLPPPVIETKADDEETVVAAKTAYSHRYK